MAKYQIRGNKRLSGFIPVSGAKNSALKLLAASILTKEVSVIHNVPEIIDIKKMEDILSNLGCKVTVSKNTVTIDPSSINSTSLDPDLTKKIRASIVLAGPMLSRFGTVSIAQPGGCLIGARPIDDHIDVLSQFGVTVEQKGDEYIFNNKPLAGEIIMSEMSVTATENAIMASVLSDGDTIIRVAAAEPEIADLADYLNQMGAKISGAGTHNIKIEGVKELHGTEHTVIQDRVEAATYLMMAIGTNSELKIGPIVPEHLSIVIKKLKKASANFTIIKESDKFYFQTFPNGHIESVNINTRTFPGFPTDLQSAYAALMTKAKGESRIFETIFESRFGYIEELKRMNANIEVISPHIILVKGSSKLRSAEIDAFDIRGGAALVLAALMCNGETTINHVEMIERGYEKLDIKLSAVGADIKRIN